MHTALRAFFVSFLVFLAPAVSAQESPDIPPKIDSFFDIFSDLSVPDIACDPCKALEQEIKNVEQQIDTVNAELAGYAAVFPFADATIAALESTLKDLDAQLVELQNPKNFIESDGRRYDSSTHAALQRRNANLYKAYKGGRMSAEEYMEEIGREFDDPAIADDLAMLKEIIENELKEKIDTTKKSLEELQALRDEYIRKEEAAKEELNRLMEALAKLKEQLLDCYKRCKEEDVNIPEDYGIGQAERGIFDDLFDFFDDLFGKEDSADDPFADIDDFLDGLGNGSQSGGEGEGDIPTEMLPLDLRSTGPVQVESFFDIFVDLDLPPPVCHLCDPLMAQIEETEQSLNDLTMQQAQAQAEVDALYRDLTAAQDVRSAAERALDELNNPQSSAESEGHRFDSSDQAAMRVRNARLWGAYKSGELSAQELSDEWGKPFDDPEVQEELNDIKQKMKEELENAKNDAQNAIDRVNERITALNEQLVDLVGGIAAHEVILDYLLKQLEECEKLCREKKDEPTGLALPAFEPKLFLDGFESGEPRSGSDDGLDGDDAEDEDSAMDDDDTDEEEDIPPERGFMDWLKFGGDDDEEKKEEGLFCGWFGLFCMDEEKKDSIEVSDLTMGYAIDCFDGNGDADLCAPLDGNNDGVVNAMDFNEWNLSLDGPKNLDLPLTVNGMDGDDSLSIADFSALNNCLQSGGPCDGLTFNPPPFFGTAPTDSFVGLTGGDFGLRLNGNNGNDVLFRDPIRDPFVGIDALPGFDPNLPLPPIPGGFFTPGSDPFAGGPPTFFGPGGNDIFPTPPPPPPRAGSEKEIIEQLVRQALAKLPKLQECEKYIVTVLRQRIGNVTRYTIRVTKTRDEAKCPACANGQYSDRNSCNNECSDLRGCVLADPKSEGNLACYVCPQARIEQSGCHSDAECDDDDQCTQDSCNSKGECTNEKIEDCEHDEGEIAGCPDIAHKTKDACTEVCTGECTEEPYQGRECWFCRDKTLECPSGQLSEGACALTCASSTGQCVKERSGCFVCKSRTSTTLQCPSPSMDIAACEKSCEDAEKGKCDKSSTRNDGVSCYSCKVATQVSEQCPSGSSANCSSSCDGTCESVKTLNDGTKCQKCVTRTTTGTTCPSGHAESASDCPSGSTAIPDSSGCFECSVVNCPSGTYKNECPSSCANGCDVAASQHEVTCYKCKQSCEEACSSAGYAKVGKDWSDHIQSYLNGYSCVSGASVSVQTATIGSCTCSNEPSVSIDSTVPVCTGTPCGDVACGQSTSCPVGENTTATVSCNWGGWKKIDMNKFQPIIGD